MRKAGRNDPCPCGSGKKYKRCCLDRDRTGPATTREERARQMRFLAARGFSAETIRQVLRADEEP